MSLSIDLLTDGPEGTRLRISGTRPDFARLAHELQQLMDGRWDCKTHAEPWSAGCRFFEQHSEGGYYFHFQPFCHQPPHEPLRGRGIAWACYGPDEDGPLDYDPTCLMVDGAEPELEWLRDRFRGAANGVARSFHPLAEMRAVFGARVELPLEILIGRSRPWRRRPPGTSPIP